MNLIMANQVSGRCSRLRHLSSKPGAAGVLHVVALCGYKGSAGGGVTARVMDSTIVPRDLWPMVEVVGFCQLRRCPLTAVMDTEPRRRGNQVGRQMPRAAFSALPTHFLPRVT